MHILQSAYAHLQDVDTKGLRRCVSGICNPLHRGGGQIFPVDILNGSRAVCVYCTDIAQSTLSCQCYHKLSTLSNLIHPTKILDEPKTTPTGGQQNEPSPAIQTILSLTVYPAPGALPIPLRLSDRRTAMARGPKPDSVIRACTGLTEETYADNPQHANDVQYADDQAFLSYQNHAATIFSYRPRLKHDKIIIQLFPLERISYQADNNLMQITHSAPTNRDTTSQSTTKCHAPHPIQRTASSP
jgi:hypothetical protein